MEEEREKLRSEQKKKLIRSELDSFNKAKVQQRAKEIQEALDMDTRILQEFVKMNEAEALAQKRRKEELRDELQSYIQYMNEQREIEKQREKDVEAIYRQQEKSMWAAKERRWQKEQEARDKLMHEVIIGRQSQLQEKRNSERMMHSGKEQERACCEYAGKGKATP